MLTLELLNNNKALEGLTDEQKKAVVSLSKNDEKTVLEAKRSEFVQEVATALNIQTTEKEFMKSLTSLKADLEANESKQKDLQKTIDSLGSEKSELEKALKDNAGDSKLKETLEKANADLKVTKEALKKAVSEKTELEKTHSEELSSLKVDFAINEASKSFAFKSTVSEAMHKLALKDAISNLKNSYKTEFDENGNLIFRGENNAVATNPKNGLKPYTAQELLSENLKAYGVLDEGRKGAGAGGGGTNGESNNSVLSLDGVKTQTEAMGLIKTHLDSLGLKPNSVEYIHKQDAIWIENNIADLPAQ